MRRIVARSLSLGCAREERFVLIKVRDVNDATPVVFMPFEIARFILDRHVPPPGPTQHIAGEPDFVPEDWDFKRAIVMTDAVCHQDGGVLSIQTTTHSGDRVALDLPLLAFRLLMHHLRELREVLRG